MNDEFPGVPLRELVLTSLRRENVIRDTGDKNSMKLDRLIHATEQLCRLLERALTPAIGPIQVTHPNGAKTMTAITLPNIVQLYLLNPNAVPPQTHNGSADFPISIQNSDGSAPTLAADTGNVTVTAPVANPGTNPAWPVAAYPYVGHVDAVTQGTANVIVSADSQADVIMPVNVNGPALEVAGVDPTLVVVNSPF